MQREEMRFRKPFRIAGYLFEGMPSIVTEIGIDGQTGRGEAAGVYYLDDGPDQMVAAVEAVRDVVSAGVSRGELQRLLPAGGARNALDCALWELESLRTGVPVWRLAGVGRPQALPTTFTLAAESPEAISHEIGALPTASAIKLKLDGELAADVERVRTVRRARPDIWLGVDANQSYSNLDELDALTAVLVDAKVGLLEQPVARGDELLLKGWRHQLPVAADESILDGGELRQHGHLFDVVNIKLDKCGGLTEALAMAATARGMGLKIMVGNMGGSSLATAPAFVLAQHCDIVDLDGPWFLANDPHANGLYADGNVFVPADLWGAAD